MRRYGRVGSWNLVRRCVGSRPSPIIVFTGTRGGGKTAMLDEIEDRLGEYRAPYARLDLSGTGPAPAHAVLDALTLEFWKKSSGYRRQRFDRHALARLVMRQDFGTRDRAEVTAAIRAMLRRRWRKSDVDELVSELADGAAQLGGAPPGAAGATVRLLLRWLPDALRVGRRPGAEWFRNRDHPRAAPEDTLATLYLAAHSEPAEHETYIEGLLFDAFVEDLRVDHRRGKSKINYVVLLDDVDEDANPGREFVAELERARKPSTPLTLVVTSREPRTDPVGPRAERNADTALDAYDPDDPPAWLPVRLPRLSADDVRAMVRDADLGPAVPVTAVADVLYAFGEGHAGATAILLEAVAASGTIGLREVLGTVRDELLGRLLGDLQANARVEERLTMCAAARDQTQAINLIAGDHPMAAYDVAEITRAELWVPGADGGPPVLLPVLRRLLLERLKERAPESSAGWNTVHRALRDQAVADGDLRGELYHRLALGETAVLDRLCELLSAPDTAGWLELVAYVTGAPNRLGAAGAPPAELNTVMQWAADADLRTKQMAELVGALWIGGDPLAGGRTEARGHVAEAFRNLALHFPRRWQELDDAARAYDQAARHTPWRGEAPRAEPLPRPPSHRAALVVVLALVAACGCALGVRAAYRCGSPLDVPHFLSYPRVTTAGEDGQERGECVGVTGTLAFRRDYAPIMAVLARENAYATRHGPGTYVTMAVAGPLSSDEPRMRHRLEGAVAGQHAANRERVTGDWPPVKLVFANMDGNEGHWQRVAGELAAMRDGEDRLVAVAGIGLSQDETVSAAGVLHNAGIPMVGDIVTADTMDGRSVPGLFRVNPHTGDQLRALSRYFTPRLKGHRALIVQYSKKSDRYTAAVAGAFKTYLGGPWKAGGEIIDPFGDHPDNEFKTITENICGADKLDTIYYAGRARDLPDFIDNIRNVPYCTGRLTVISTSDTTRLRVPSAENRGARQTLSNTKRPVTLVYTPLAEPVLLRSTGAFTDFRTTFVGLGFDESHLDTGWATAEHDAVLVASRAVHLASARPKLPAPENVEATLRLMNVPKRAVAGASGPIYLDSVTGNRVAACVPVLRFVPDRDPVPLDRDCS